MKLLVLEIVLPVLGECFMETNHMYYCDLFYWKKWLLLLDATVAALTSCLLARVKYILQQLQKQIIYSQTLPYTAAKYRKFFNTHSFFSSVSYIFPKKEPV